MSERRPSLTTTALAAVASVPASRKPSLTPDSSAMLSVMLATASTTAPQPTRKHSLTLSSASMLSAIAGGGSSSSRKPSLTSDAMLSAMAATGNAATRKHSLTSASMAAAAAAGLASTQPPSSSPRERKPSLTSVTAATAAAAAGQASPSSPLGRKPSGDRKPSLSSVGMAALATASGQHGTGTGTATGTGSSPTASSRHSLTTATPRSPSSRHLLRESGASSPSPSTKPAQQNPLLAMKATRRSFSSSFKSLEPRMDLFFHVPAHRELQRLRVPRTLTLIGLQALVQREFAIPFEDQCVYWHGDLLEGDEDLAFYDIHDQSVLNIRVRKRYRTIGDVFTKIKTVQFSTTTTTTSTRSTTNSSSTTDYEIVEIVAPLPPTHMLFKRLVLAISYLQRLDGMQAQRTQRRVWRQRVSFWDETSATAASTTIAATTTTIAGRRRSSVLLQQATAAVAAHGGSPRVSAAIQRRNSTDKPQPETGTGTPTPAAPPPPAVSSYVMLHSGPERVSYLVSLSQIHAIPQRLQLPVESRSPSDLRHIKKWLSGLKFFSSAALPDTAIHEIARACVYVRYAAGEFLFRQGDVGDHFYILISGCVSLAAYGNGFFATMTPGRCFGEISLIEGQSGLRTASATVNFAAPFAELAVVSGDIFRRVINPYKRAVLQQTEKAIYSVPQLRALPDNIITHVAYASKALEAKPGKLLVHHGEEVNVLVLLVKGEVKVSVTVKRCQEEAAGTASNSMAIAPHPVVSVVRAPAVFCQEGALTNTPSPAPWDIEALDHCSLLCLRTDTISIFLATRQEIIRALYREHTLRLDDFQRRFGHAAPPPSSSPVATGSPTAATAAREMTDDRTQSPRKSSAAKLAAEKAAYMRMLTAKLFESQRSLFAEPSRRRSRRGAAANVQIHFPKILLRGIEQRREERDDELDDDDDDNQSRSFHRGSNASQQQQQHDDDDEDYDEDHASSVAVHHQQLHSSAAGQSCADLHDAFLHRTLPHGNILDLRDQIQFCSLASRELEQRQREQQLELQTQSVGATDHARGRTRALLRGLRRLPVEEVALCVATEDMQTSTPQTHADGHYRFVALRPPTSPSHAAASPSPANAKRRTLQTR